MYPARSQFSILLAAGEALAAGVSHGECDVLIPSASVVSGSVLSPLVAEIAAWGAPCEPTGKRICPRTREALAAGAVFVGSTASSDDAAELAAHIAGLISLFPIVELALGDRADLASLVVRVPFDDATVGSRVVEATHRIVKIQAIEAGLLPGEFGRALFGLGSRFTEVHTRLSGVCEYLVLRKLLPADLKYVRDNPEWFSAFEQRVGGTT